MRIWTETCGAGFAIGFENDEPEIIPDEWEMNFEEGENDDDETKHDRMERERD